MKQIDNSKKYKIIHFAALVKHLIVKK